MRRVIGMDIHRTFAEVVFWEDGKLRPAGRISMTRAGLEGFGRSLGKEDEVVIEATGNAMAVVRVLSPYVARVIVANPAAGAGVGIDGPVNAFQRGRHGFAVFTGHEIEAVAQQVNDAGLHGRLREDRGDRLGKALQAVDHGDTDQHVLDAAVFQLVHDAQPELGTSFCSSHRPRISLVPSARTPSAMCTALLRTIPHGPWRRGF